MEKNNNVYSDKVRAGKKNYFVDIKETRAGGYYLLVSERRKNFNEDGTFTIEKSRILIYPEDLSRLTKALSNAFTKMKELMPSYDFTKFEKRDQEREAQETIEQKSE